MKAAPTLNTVASLTERETAAQVALTAKDAELSAARSQLEGIKLPDDTTVAAAARHLEDLLASNAKESDIKRAESALLIEREKRERASSETEQVTIRARMRVAGLERQREILAADVERLAADKREALRQFLESEMEVSKRAYLDAIEVIAALIVDIQALWLASTRAGYPVPAPFGRGGSDAHFPMLIGREHRQRVHLGDVETVMERRLAAIQAAL